VSTHVTQPTPANNEAPPAAAPALESTARQLDVQLYKVCDVARALSMSRTVVFELLRSGRLRSVKQGRTRLIPAAAIRDYIALLEKEAEAA
jgi:excisionase family DNA binding protein